MSLLQKIVVPMESVNDEYITVVKLYVPNSKFVEKGELLLDIETSKTVICIEAAFSGYVLLHCSEGEELPIGALLVSIMESEKETIISDPTTLEEIKKGEDKTSTRFSLRARELIVEHELDEQSFSDMGFVTKHDIMSKFVAKKNSYDNCNYKNGPSTKVPYEAVKLSKSKKAEIKCLTNAERFGLTSSVNVVVDAGVIQDILKEKLKKFNDSFLPLIIYECSRLLKKYRIFNSFLYSDNLALYKNINIGIAVDIDEGLKVLNIPNADKLSLYSLEDRVISVIDRYLDKKLSIEDLSDSTFIITDLSSYGVDSFLPLINAEQSAILGISSLDLKLNRFKLTLSFDHRVSEGKTASEFLTELKNRLESYSLDSTVRNCERFRCSICLKTLDEDDELSGYGLLKMINHDGIETYICRNCILGYQ